MILQVAQFDGYTYEPEFDYVRLTGQNKRVHGCVGNGGWWTLDEISEETGDPQASVSARLRDLRKEKFGGYTIDKRPRGGRSKGLWEYRMGRG